MSQSFVELGRSSPISWKRAKGLSTKRRYEHATLAYKLAVPFLYLIGAYAQAKKATRRALGYPQPATNFWLVDGISAGSRRVKDGAARWQALDACYNFSGNGEGRNAVVRSIDKFWMCIRNAQAVRNRLKIARHELIVAIEERARSNQPVRILSLAAGTAQGVIEAAARCRVRGIRTEILLIDADDSALAHARALAAAHGIGECVTANRGDVLRFDKNGALGGFRPDIVEMMGLIDYLSDEMIVLLIKRIRRLLTPGGIFFTCHIHHNAEAYFLRHAVNWQMRYRSVGQLRALVEKGGFAQPRLLTERHRIHTIAVARL